MLSGITEISEEELAKVKIKSNYHTHNFLCNHAEGNVCDYVEAAVSNGLNTIGISDHCIPPVGAFAEFIKYINIDTLPRDYLPQFDKARKLYGDKIKILKAVEIEYYDGHDDFYRKLLTYLDYLVMGQHEYLYKGTRKSSFSDGLDEENILAYCDNVITGINSGFFSVVAHPDLIFYQKYLITEKIYNAFDKLVQEAVKDKVALELNANGLRSHNGKYPTNLLIELCKKHNAEVVVSSDCHSPKVLCDDYTRRLYAYAKKEKLNVIEEIRTNVLDR